jgi:carboxymethylenebutenolidase
MQISSSTVHFIGGNSKRKTDGFLAAPNALGRHPGVIVIHEIFGLVDHIEDVSMRLAREGYVALAVDLFEGKTITKLEEGRRFREKLTEEKILADLNGGHAYLKTLDNVNAKRIGSIGFCMGGGLSLLLACHNPELAATVVFYGRNPPFTHRLGKKRSMPHTRQLRRSRRSHIRGGHKPVERNPHKARENL